MSFSVCEIGRPLYDEGLAPNVECVDSEEVGFELFNKARFEIDRLVLILLIFYGSYEICEQT